MLRLGALLLALALTPFGLSITAAWLIWDLSFWSLSWGLACLSIVTALLLYVLGKRGSALCGWLALLLGPVSMGLRASVAHGNEGFQLITLPGPREMRWPSALFPEADGCHLAAQLIQLRGGLPDEEGPRFHAILREAYARADADARALPTPAIDTYLHLQSPASFDTVVISRDIVKPEAALIFLHGYAGNFYVYCAEAAAAAAQANMLTVCPSVTQQGAWWNEAGEQTFRATLRYLKGRGMKRVYLAGLSNGGAGASVIAPRHTKDLSGLILISGVGANRPPPLPTLVIQGSRDRMMRASRARAYAAHSAQARYRELSGGHLIFLSQHQRVRSLIAEFLREREHDLRR